MWIKLWGVLNEIENEKDKGKRTIQEKKTMQNRMPVKWLGTVKNIPVSSENPVFMRSYIF